jgi:tetratricopeptide (TPR) repeat protein
MNDLDPDPTRYGSRLSRLSLADALSGQGHHDEAITFAREVHEHSTEPLLCGIALQAQGEYHAQAGRFGEALALFELAQPLYPAGDQSPDFALLLKWRGYVHAHLGDRRKGTQLMDAAIKILRKPGIRFEAWLDILRLKYLVGILSKKEQTTLANYPGLAPGFKSQLTSLSTSFDPDVPIPTHFFIDLASNEYFVRGQAHLGIPLELRALAYLRLTGEWGVSMVRLKGLLWKDQANAYLQLEGRLHQVFRILRVEHTIEVMLIQGLASLSPDSLSRVSVVSEQTVPGFPRFLRSRAEFTRAEHERHYRLSRAQSSVWIIEWERSGWITREGQGPATRYRVTLSSSS